MMDDADIRDMFAGLGDITIKTQSARRSSNPPARGNGPMTARANR
jgi:hypothetical protein